MQCLLAEGERLHFFTYLKDYRGMEGEGVGIGCIPSTSEGDNRGIFITLSLS